MKREIVIPFDGDSSLGSRDNLIKALEEQLEKYQGGGNENDAKRVNPNTEGHVSASEFRKA